MPTVFVSDRIGPDRLVGGPGCADLAERGGWGALAGLYRASLAAAGRMVVPILRPEIYQTDIARRVLGAGPGDWHLCIKPAGHIRPFHGLANVVVATWPSTPGVPPFDDPLRQLRTADAVLCDTDATAAGLRAAGLERVFTLPPQGPGFVAGLVRLEALLAARGP